MNKTVRKSIFIFCVLTMVCSLAYILNYFIDWQQQKQLEQRQQEWIKEIPSLPTTVDFTELPESSSTISGQNDLFEEDSTVLMVTEPPDYRERFQTILDQNLDFFGLLSIPGTNMENKLVVQGSDNEFYLNHDFEGKSSSRGTLFLDTNNRPNFIDNNYVIYGHNMRDGSMFHEITKYESSDYYLKAPVITFDTVDGPTTWLIFAAYVCEPEWDYYRTSFSEYAFAELLDEIYMRSYYHTSVEVLPSDTILTLSTCVYDFQDARFALQARMLRKGESIENMTFTTFVGLEYKTDK